MKPKYRILSREVGDFPIINYFDKEEDARGLFNKEKENPLIDFVWFEKQISDEWESKDAYDDMCWETIALHTKEAKRS